MEKYIWNKAIFEKIIEDNSNDDTFILYGSFYKEWWMDFVESCNKYDKIIVLLTPKSSSPDINERRLYPSKFRKVLLYPNVFHWETCALGLGAVLNKKANIYKNQYGGCITNSLLLRRDGAEDGYETNSIGKSSRDIINEFWGE